MSILSLSVTEAGRALADRLPFARRHGDPRAALAEHWSDVDGFVVFLAVGATVRLIAPLLTKKADDPAVVCVDEAGRYAVVVCGGHAAGGNWLAAEVARLLGAEPVVTTATDRLGMAALDQLPGFRAEGEVAAVTRLLLDRPPVEATLLDQPAVRIENARGWPLPDRLLEAVSSSASDELGSARIVVSDRIEPLAGTGPTVWLRPASLVIGVGTSTDASALDVDQAVTTALNAAALSRSSVSSVSTVDRRAEHPAIAALAAALGVPVVAATPAVLGGVTVPNPSDVVQRAVGTPSVAEAAALLAAGPGAELVVQKTATARVTVAIARRAGPSGRVAVVGLGPGSPLHRTPAAERAIRRAQVVVGYHAYVEQCRDLLEPHQQVTGFDLGAELERAAAALEAAAAGRTVALVCSGDAGVYAMASPVLDIAEAHFPGVEVEVVPGVTAGLAASALLGAPLGHDHAVVSLSDLHTPWDAIAARIAAAAEADYVLVLYNPRSLRRTWQIEKVKTMLLERRRPDTPVGLVTDAARPGQQVRLTSLGELPCEEITMTTCVVIGASTTRVAGGRMVTPRGYDR